MNKTKFNVLKDKEAFKRLLIIVAIVMAFVFLSYIFLTRVEGQAHLQCSTGDIKGNYLGNWDLDGNFSNKYLYLNEIDNMNCVVEVGFDAPWWFFGGFR
jgi:hypothetical protein